MLDIGVSISFLTMAVGLGLFYYFAKRSLPSGSVIGILILLEGVLLFAALSGFVSTTVGIVAVFPIVFGCCFASFFLFGRKPRTLFLLIIPAILLALYLV